MLCQDSMPGRVCAALGSGPTTRGAGSPNDPLTVRQGTRLGARAACIIVWLHGLGAYLWVIGEH